MTKAFANVPQALADVDKLAVGQTISVGGRFAVVVGGGNNKTIRFPRQQSYAQTQIRDGRKFHSSAYGKSYEEI